jgi:hypothetical protein
MLFWGEGVSERRTPKSTVMGSGRVKSNIYMILIMLLGGGVSSIGDFLATPADSSALPTTCLIYLYCRLYSFT